MGRVVIDMMKRHEERAKQQPTATTITMGLVAAMLVVATVNAYNVYASNRALESIAKQRLETEVQRLDTEVSRLEATADANYTSAQLHRYEFEAFRRWMDRHDTIDLVDRICWDDGE